MHALAAAGGLVLVLTVLLDAFETVVLPRRITRRLSLTRWFYLLTWSPWSAVGRRIGDPGWRENFLSFFGPLSLLLLIGVWAGGAITGFAVLQWGLEADFAAPEGDADFGAILYASGSTFFTLGFGDVVPLDAGGRAVSVVEVGTGFATLALVVGYLPVLYQAFWRREVSITLLDARAGSPPTAAAFLQRQIESDPSGLEELFRDWERWTAELLESHLSYPVLGLYRSQHERESWLAALTTVLDASALVIAGAGVVGARHAPLTFAIARHAAVDLSQVFGVRPRPPATDRLPPANLAIVCDRLAVAGLTLVTGPGFEQRLYELRVQYEPYLNGLSIFLLMPLPQWLPVEGAVDDWQVSEREIVPRFRRWFSRRSSKV